MFLACGHNKFYICSEQNLICEEKCNKELDCGHDCESVCHAGNCKCKVTEYQMLPCKNH